MGDKINIEKQSTFEKQSFSYTVIAAVYLFFFSVYRFSTDFYQFQSVCKIKQFLRLWVIIGEEEYKIAWSVNMGIKQKSWRGGWLKQSAYVLENLHSQESSFSESHEVRCIFQKKRYLHFLEIYVQQKILFRHQFKLTIVKRQWLNGSTSNQRKLIVTILISDFDWFPVTTDLLPMIFIDCSHFYHVTMRCHAHFDVACIVL